MATGGVGLKAEYVTEPVAPEATVSAAPDGQENTIVVAPEVEVGWAQVDDTLAIGAV